jgi:hypothetical protein
LVARRYPQHQKAYFEAFDSDIVLRSVGLSVTTDYHSSQVLARRLQLKSPFWPVDLHKKGFQQLLGEQHECEIEYRARNLHGSIRIRLRL